MKKYICEFVGTMMLVLLACGVAVVSGGNYVATALAFGLVIVAMAYSIGNVSGCHINPAVSVGMAIAGKMSWKECVKYVIAQVLGAIAGAAILGYLLGSFDALGANTTNGVLEATGITVGTCKSLIVECLLTFVFVLTILGVTDKAENGHNNGLVIGLALTLVHLFGIPFTGTSVNPARSIGPALLQQTGDVLPQLWVFIVAPLVGAAIAGLFFKYILKEKEARAKSKK